MINYALLASIAAKRKQQQRANQIGHKLVITDPYSEREHYGTIRLLRYTGERKPQIWADCPDARAEDLIRTLDGVRYEGQLNLWFIPEKTLPMLCRKILADPYYRRRFWPMRTKSTEIKQLLNQFKAEDQARRESLKPVAQEDVPEQYRHKQYIPRHYQFQCARWADTIGLSLIALPMGTGKGITALTLFKMQRERNPKVRALVICTASTKYSTWPEEINKFTNFTQTIITGNVAKRTALYNSDADFTIVNFDLLHRDVTLIKNMIKQDRNFKVLIVDEAMYLKTPRSQRTKAFSQIKKLMSTRADFKCTLMTGTPMENHLRELHTVVGLINPSIFGRWSWFKRKYCVESGDGFGSIEQDKANNKGELFRTLQPIMFRRTEEELGEQLPTKVEMDVRLDLPSDIRRIYDEVKDETARLIEESDDKDPNFLARMTKLRQICDSVKLKSIGLEESQNVKINWIKTMLSNELSQHKLIIFTQFAEMAKILHQELKSWNPSLLTGSIKGDDRQELIHDFQRNVNTKLLIMTTAGAEGLNLQQAQGLILFDHLWNPQKVNQIIRRGIRIGSQHKNFLVIRLIIRKSIEENILRLQKGKQNLFDAVIEGKMVKTGRKHTPKELARILIGDLHE